MEKLNCVWVVFYQTGEESQWNLFDAYETRRDALNAIVRCKDCDREGSTEYTYMVKEYVAREAKGEN